MKRTAAPRRVLSSLSQGMFVLTTSAVISRAALTGGLMVRVTISINDSRGVKQSNAPLALTFTVLPSQLARSVFMTTGHAISARISIRFFCSCLS